MKNSLDDAAKKVGETVIFVVVLLGSCFIYSWLTVIFLIARYLLRSMVTLRTSTLLMDVFSFAQSPAFLPL